MKHLRNYAAFIMVLTFQRCNVHATDQVPDNQVWTPATATFFLGQPKANISCKFLGTPYGVYWMKGSTPATAETLLSHKGGKVFGPRFDDGSLNITDDYSLVFNNVQAGDEGNYICRVSNHNGFLIFNNTDVRVLGYACTVPSLEENVSSSCSTGTSVSYSDLCSFSCPTGFNLVGESSVTCTSSGSFLEPFPRCEVSTCTVPSLEVNVSSSCSTGTSVSYSDLCSFSCPTGFNLIGASSVTCTGSGSFSEPFPRCEVSTCTVPSLKVNVSSSCSTGTSVSYSDLCSFSCPTGFNLIGASIVTCTSSGSFSEPFPACEVTTCTVPSSDENVPSSCSPGTSVSHNQQCSFSCPIGYSRAGPSSVTCTGSGSFSQVFPRCEEVSACAAIVVGMLVALLGISRCVHDFTCRHYQNELEALRSINIQGGENTKL